MIENGANIHFKLIAKVLGFILLLQSGLIFITSVISIYYKEDCTQSIFFSGMITLVVSILLSIIGYRTKVKSIYKRDSVIMVSFSWLFFSLFGMLPFYLSGAIPSFTNAFFETVSGITTTGSTILEKIEEMPRSLLFWRSLLQWMGGLGMIVFVLAFLPILVSGGGSSQLFDDEMTGIVRDKFQPRVGQVAKRLWLVYFGFTFILYILLILGPMSPFDALCHSLSTMSSGGFSTKQASIAYWDSMYLDIVISIFMLVASISFALWYFVVNGDVKKLYKNEELRWFLAIIFIAVILVTFSLSIHTRYETLFERFRYAFFQVITLISSSGFSTSDFTDWSAPAIVILSIVMVIGGCGGSTSGGMKIIRFLVLSKNTMNEFNKQIHPRAVLPVRVDGQVISIETVQRILAFAFVYIFIIIISMFVFSATGLTFEESWGAAISGVSNIGPGLGSIGPDESFADLTIFAKWYYCFLMITGRLELFTVLLLFTPTFWKK